MEEASLRTGVSLRSALGLLFFPSRRRVGPDVFASRVRLALSGPLAMAGIASIAVAVAVCISLAVLTAPPKPEAEAAVRVASPVVGGMTEPIVEGLGASGLGAPGRVDEDAPTTSAAADAFWGHMFLGSKIGKFFRDVGIHVPFTYVANGLCVAQGVGGLVLLAGAVLAWRRRDGSLNRVRTFYMAAYLIPLLGFYVVVEAVNILLLGPLEMGPDGPVRLGPVVLYGEWVLSNWWVVPIKLGLVAGLLIVETLLIAAHILARSDEASGLYKSEKIARQNLGILHAGTNKDRRVRTSYLQSAGAHVIVILVLPWVLIFGAWTSHVDAYPIVGGELGGGGQERMKVEIEKPKSPKRLRLITGRVAGILFERPEITDSEVNRRVETVTENQYVANTNIGPGLPGPGKPGKPGWPGGFSDGEIRFIRLEHGGLAWDDGMTNEKGRADQNFLEHIREVGGFKIRTPESIPITQLNQFKKGQAPPFVFITGRSLSGITSADRKTLWTYCMDGGLIFADGSGGSFDREFRDLMGEIFPDQPLSDIPNDDAIYRQPYSFPTGAPALWSHASNPRPQGVRAPGTSRLCVFYFPGDLHDAWKSGHSGLSSEKYTSAYKLGINVVSYAFTHYADMHPAKK